MNAEDRGIGASVAAAAPLFEDNTPAARRQAGGLDSELGQQLGGLMETQTISQTQIATEAERNSVEFDEAALAAESISGSSQAFEELYAHYFPKVRALCIRKIGNAHLAEDIAQEAFARAFERISEFGGPRHFGGWVGTIAANLCTDHLRRKKPVASVDQMIETESKTPVYEFDPIRNVQREDTSRLVRLALAKLDPRQREALVLHEVKGMSCAAVGEHLGISEVAAESLLARARRRLRKEITAKAIPADLFNLGGLALLPALLRAWKRARYSADQRLGRVQSAANRSWESVGGNLIPAVDAAKAVVVVVGAALATQFATAASPAAHAPELGSTSAATVSHSGPTGSLIAPDGDGGSSDGYRSPISIHADPSSGAYGASVESHVNVPDPSGSDGYTGLNVDIDLSGEGLANDTAARIFVQDKDGKILLDTGRIERGTDLR